MWEREQRLAIEAVEPTVSSWTQSCSDSYEWGSRYNRFIIHLLWLDRKLFQNVLTVPLKACAFAMTTLVLRGIHMFEL